jgi:hypothetical protein
MSKNPLHQGNVAIKQLFLRLKNPISYNGNLTLKIWQYNDKL